MDMQENTGNPYWRLAAEELKRFESQPPAVDPDIEAHKQRIREEEARARAVFEQRRSGS